MNRPKGSKKKFTLIATEAGVEKAEKALMRLGFESQTNFAAAILMSRSTVSKFFNRKPIQLDSFKRICEQLGDLKWQEIAGISEKKLSETIKARDYESSRSEEVDLGSTIQRQVTVIDPQRKPEKTVIILQGDIESVPNLKILQSILREHSGNTIEIQDIQSGSIKISLEGSPEDVNKLIAAIRSGELEQLDGFPIEDIVEVDAEAAIKENNNDKWQLVRQICEAKINKSDLQEVDLSDADLINADLISADLINANLINADLSGANLINANLINADLSGADLSGANLISADLSGANLRSADLSGANLRSANLINADLISADLINANLRSADLSGANLINANLSGANLSGADLSGANLSGSKIDDKTKLDSKWRTVWEIVNQPQINRDLSGYDLSNANLSYVELINSRLVQANLENTNLSNSNLSQANLIGANLKNAVLGFANLTDADLSGADVTKARFGNNQGINETLKQNLIAKGAIFEDDPGSHYRERDLIPV